MNTDNNNIRPEILEEDNCIDAYLKGQMSHDEEEQFLKELNANPEMRKRAIITARLIKGLKEVESERYKHIYNVFLASSKHNVTNAAEEAATPFYRAENAFGIDNEKEVITEEITKKTDIEKQQRRGKKFTSFRKIPKWLSIAASLICIVWLGLTYHSYRTTTALGDQYDDAFNSGITARGQETQTEAEKKLQMLFIKVKDSKNLDDVIHELSLYWELSTMETYNDYTNYSAEIGWKLTIAYLKNNDKKEARNVLNKLIEYYDEESDIRLRAMDLLNKL